MKWVPLEHALGDAFTPDIRAAWAAAWSASADAMMTDCTRPRRSATSPPTPRLSRPERRISDLYTT